MTRSSKVNEILLLPASATFILEKDTLIQELILSITLYRYSRKGTWRRSERTLPVPTPQLRRTSSHHMALRKINNDQRAQVESFLIILIILSLRKRAFVVDFLKNVPNDWQHRHKHE